MSTLSPSVDEFAEALAPESRWYTFGILLGIASHALDVISDNYSSEGVVRCLRQLYQCAKTSLEEKRLSWEYIIIILRKIDNNALADKIYSRYLQHASSDPSWSDGRKENETCLPQGHGTGSSFIQVQTRLLSANDEFALALTGSSSVHEYCVDTGGKSTGSASTALISMKVTVSNDVSQKFLSISQKYTALMMRVKNAFSKSNSNTEELQLFITQIFSLKPLSEEQKTLNNVMQILLSSCYFFNIGSAEAVVNKYLGSNEELQREFMEYKELVDNFKCLYEMRHLVELHVGKTEECVENEANEMMLRLQVFWSTITFKVFEMAMQKMFKSLYNTPTNITISIEGYLCVSWVVSDLACVTSEPLPEDRELKVIGILFLRVGDKVVYELSGKGCVTIEATMLQAVEMKCARAIEVLLLLGCKPEISTYNKGVSLTHIVNIKGGRKRMGTGSVEHACVLGHDQNIQAILNSSEMREEMQRKLQQENKELELKLEKKDQHVEALKFLEHKETEWLDLLKSAAVKVSEIEAQKFDFQTKIEQRERDLQSIFDKLKATLARLTETKTINKDDQRMAELVMALIKRKGCMELRSVRGILVGPSGVGKTTTIKRLTGQFEIIVGPSVAKLFHPNSFVIGKFWSSLAQDQQLQTLLDCMIHHPMRLETEEEFDVSHKSLQEVLVPEQIQQLSTQSLSQHSTPAFSQSINTPMDAYFVLLKELIKQSRWDTIQTLLDRVNDTTLFHVIDIAGGPPELFEILPLLLRGPCFSLIFLNLAYQLTHHTPTAHPLAGHYYSSYTQLEMVHMLLASIHSLNSGEEFFQKSAAFLIGTHLDQAKSSDVIKSMKEIEESLKGTSLHHKDVLAKYFCQERKLHTFLYALDSLNGSEEELSLLRDTLTHLIKRIFPPENLPIPWGIFHLMLHHKYEEKGLCTLEESEVLGKACGLMLEKEKDEVKIALRFFHSRFSTILYYPEIESLQNIVICDPNLLFQLITRLVVESNAPHVQDAENIRLTGEISYVFFEHVCKMSDPLQCIPTNAIVDLLQYHNIVTEVGNVDRRLFMSFLLRPYTADSTEDKISSTQEEVAPLLFTFHPHGYQPIGLFHVLTSKLLQSKVFFLDMPRFRNKIMFIFGEAMVEVRSLASHLQVKVEHCSPKQCVHLRKCLQETLDSIMADVPHMKNIQVDVSFSCPKAPTDYSHIATLNKVEPLFNDEESLLLHCSKSHGSMHLESCHRTWFNDSDNIKREEAGDMKNSSLILTMRPETNDAYQLLKPKATHWNGIAIELGVEAIYRYELRMLTSLDARDKLECVIKKWEESECSDFTWRTLIEAMKELEYNDVLRAIQEFLAKPDVIKKYQSKKD